MGCSFLGAMHFQLELWILIAYMECCCWWICVTFHNPLTAFVYLLWESSFTYLIPHHGQKDLIPCRQRSSIQFILLIPNLQILEIREAVEEAADSQALKQIQSQVQDLRQMFIPLFC